MSNASGKFKPSVLTGGREIEDVEGIEIEIEFEQFVKLVKLVFGERPIEGEFGGLCKGVVVTLFIMPDPDCFKDIGVIVDNDEIESNGGLDDDEIEDREDISNGFGRLVIVDIFSIEGKEFDCWKYDEREGNDLTYWIDGVLELRVILGEVDFADMRANAAWAWVEFELLLSPLIFEDEFICCNSFVAAVANTFINPGFVNEIDFLFFVLFGFLDNFVEEEDFLIVVLVLVLLLLFWLSKIKFDVDFECCKLERDKGLECIRECLVSSSDLEKRLKQPGKLHWCGFSPVWVLICLVWCSNLLNDFSQSGHL